MARRCFHECTWHQDNILLICETTHFYPQHFVSHFFFCALTFQSLLMLREQGSLGVRPIHHQSICMQMSFVPGYGRVFGCLVSLFHHPTGKSVYAFRLHDIIRNATRSWISSKPTRFPRPLLHTSRTQVTIPLIRSRPCLLTVLWTLRPSTT